MKYYENNDYHATTKWPYAISAGCVVYRFEGSELKILLLKREVGHSYNPEHFAIYNVPKGHVERSETLEQTAVRETEEEAGCKVKLKTYLGSTLRNFQHPKYNHLNVKTTHYFAGLWKRDLEQIDQEHDSKLWVSVAEAIKLLEETGAKRGEAEVVRRLVTFLEQTS